MRKFLFTLLAWASTYYDRNFFCKLPCVNSSYDYKKHLKQDASNANLREYYLGEIGVETTLNKASRKVENSKSHEFVLKLISFSFLKTVFLLRHHSFQVFSFSVNSLNSWDRKSFYVRYFLAISSKEFALVTIRFYFIIINKTCVKM